MPRRNLTFLLIATVVSWLCYERAGRNRYVGTLTEAMNIVTTNYISEVEPRVLFEGAMDGMIGKLDPYSGYTSPGGIQPVPAAARRRIRRRRNRCRSRRRKRPAQRGRGPDWQAGLHWPAFAPATAIVAIDGKETKELALRDAVE